MESALRRLLDLLKKNGAELNPSATMVEEDGNLRVESSLDRSSRQAIAAIPKHCMLPQKHFEIGIEQGDFILTSTAAEVTPLQIELQELMLEIYNLSHKVETERNTSMALLYDKDDPLMAQLLSARPAMRERLETWCTNARDEDDLLISAFIKTRTLNLKSEDTRNPALMPVLDFLNHHARAAGFVAGPGDPGQEHLGVLSGKFVENSDESFVRYGRFDYLDLLLTYNFLGAEAAVDFVRSVPMELDLGKFGRIAVNSFAGRPLDKLPEKLQDLKHWIPFVIDKSDGRLEVSNIQIPGTHSWLALRRTLAVLLNTLGTVNEPGTAHELTLAAEQQVLRTNLAFYSALQLAAENAPLSRLRSVVLSVCAFQIDLIEQYKNGLKLALARHQSARVKP